MAPIRVMIVDDHDVVRRGLHIFLQAFDDLELVGEAHNGVEALQQCGKYQPDVILMDIIMPQMDGITATRLIRQDFPNTQVVALTSYKDDQSVEAMMQAGAIGYLLKNSGIDELANTILAAHRAQTS